MPSLMHRRRALKQLITYIGLDVHKETIAVALAEAGKRNEVREYGKIANTPAAVKALVARPVLVDHEAPTSAPRTAGRCRDRLSLPPRFPTTSLRSFAHRSVSRISKTIFCSVILPGWLSRQRQ